MPEDLKQLKDYARLPEDGTRPLVSAFEIRGRELVLYWRDLAPEQKIEVPVDLICRVPGEYSGPGEPGVSVLQRRQQVLDRAAGRDDHAGEVSESSLARRASKGLVSNGLPCLRCGLIAA